MFYKKWKEARASKSTERKRMMQEKAAEREKEKQENLSMAGNSMINFDKILKYLENEYPYYPKDIKIESDKEGLRWSIKVTYKYID